MAGNRKYNPTERHLEYTVKGSRGEQCVAMTLKGLTVHEIARELGMSPSNVSRTIAKVMQNATMQGYDPDHELDAPLPEGINLKGVTNLYGFENGKRVLRSQYVLGRKGIEDREAALQAFAEGLPDKITPAKRVKQTKGVKYATDVLPSIFIGDAHIGMRAFGQETKHHDFDTQIATDQLKEAFHYLTDRAIPSENSLFVNVGDLIHADSQKNTTYSGTPLDTDTRHHAVMRAAAETMAYGINLQLQKHKSVTVVMARGNHDTESAGHLQLMLEFYYKDEPRVNVLPSHGFFHYVEWGQWLLGIHHGDKQKAERLVSSMARDMAEAWGRTSHRMWCTGHFHKEAVKTLDGCKHKVFAALPPPDSWHASHGFAGDGEMEMITFKREGGVHSSHVFNVPQPRLQPDVRIK